MKDFDFLSFLAGVGLGTWIVLYLHIKAFIQRIRHQYYFAHRVRLCTAHMDKHSEIMALKDGTILDETLVPVLPAPMVIEEHLSKCDLWLRPLREDEIKVDPMDGVKYRVKKINRYLEMWYHYQRSKKKSQDKTHVKV